MAGETMNPIECGLKPQKKYIKEMNEKVKVKFLRYKNVVLMEVLEMPENYRAKGELIASEWTSIHSIGMPDIRGSVLYLRGNMTECDNAVHTWTYKTTADALKAIKNFSELIHKLNEGDAETTEPTSDDEFEITIAE